MLRDRRGDEIDQNIDDEIRFHLEMRAASYARLGVDPERAKKEAQDRFGNVDSIRKECREISMNFLDKLVQDVRYAVRTLSSSRGFTAVALASIILGIGATTTVFSLVNGVLLRPLPFASPDRLVMVWESFRKNPGNNRTSIANYMEWKTQQDVFEDLGAMQFYFPVTLTSMANSEQLEGQRLTANFFQILGVQPILGRGFTAEDQSRDARVILISYEFWQRQFAADPDIVGKTLALDGSNHTILGVMPVGMRFFRQATLMSRDPSIWLPLGQFNGQHKAGEPHYLHVIGRLKPGVSVQQAQTAMKILGARFESEHAQFDKDMEVIVQPMQEAFAGDARTPLLVLMGAVCFVLLIANANVASLLLARASTRHREIAVRSAMGGSRGRLIQQLLTESALLSLTGGVAGFLVAIVTVPALVRLAPAESIPSTTEIGVDLTVLCFAVAVSVGTGLIFGLAPAWQTTGPNLNDYFKRGGRTSSATTAAQHTREVLVAVEIAVASVLLVGAGLMIRTYSRLAAVDPGFRPDNVMVVQIHLPRFSYAKPTGRKAGATELSLIAVSPELPIRVSSILNRIGSIPGVDAAAVSSYLPLMVGFSYRGFQIAGAPPDANRGGAGFTAVSPEYFRAMGIPLLNGRYFAETDSLESEWVALVSKSTASRYWPSDHPVGRKIVLRDRSGIERPRQIVGVVGDVRGTKLDEEPGRMLYVPYQQQPEFYAHTDYRDRHFPNFLLRSRSDPGAVISLARKAIVDTDPGIPVTDVRTLRTIVDSHTARPRFLMALLTAFAGIALLLAMVGIYGVIAYSIRRRTHEIGIRRAVGATTNNILMMILKRGVMLAIIGLAAGLAASIYLTKFISTWLYGVGATDTTTIAAVSLCLLAIAGLACYLPARRAAELDPLSALRHE
ncbi:MAG: ABC transporter permease [Bryobacteraceae bacterium]